MADTTHNARLLSAIQRSRSLADRAGDTAGLLHAVQVFRDFKGPLAFNNVRPMWFTGIGISLLALAALIYWATPLWFYSWLQQMAISPFAVSVGIAATGIMMLIACGVFVGNRQSLIPDLSSYIAQRSAYAGMGLAYADNLDDVLARLQKVFSEYDRGDYSRELTYTLSGVYQGELHRLEYACHQLHFVNERVVTETVSDGKGGTKTVTKIVYDHFDRHSMTVSFPWVREITVRSDDHTQADRAQRWRPTSSDFNRVFALSGVDQISCAKFAKPVTVLHLLKMASALADVNLEFSAGGTLCLSFDNDSLLHFSVPSSLTKPDAFYQAIEAGVRLPHLVAVLGMVHKLAEQHDDNFQTHSPTLSSLEQ